MIKNHYILMMILRTWLLVHCFVSSICVLPKHLKRYTVMKGCLLFLVCWLCLNLPYLLLQFVISYISYNPLRQLPENRCWFFCPIGTKLNNVSSCVPFTQNTTCLLFCYNRPKSNENGKISISSSYIINYSWYH